MVIVGKRAAKKEAVTSMTLTFPLRRKFMSTKIKEITIGKRKIINVIVFKARS